MILGIGFNKTGTLSLAAALRTLGYVVEHNHWANAQRCCGLEELTADDGRFQQDVAYLDGPLHAHWQELRRLYGGRAKFIFTIRDVDEWIASRMIHVLHNIVLHPQDPWRNVNTAEGRCQYQTHRDRVRNAFAGDPDFLEIDVTAGDGWDQLCQFLRRPHPGVDWPRHNRGQIKLRELLKHYNQRDAHRSA